MFNRCWRWRVLFARRSDGSITPSQWGTLQDHLVSCASCRKIAEADNALQTTFDHPLPRLAPEAAAAFDTRVVATVMAGRLNSAPQPGWLLRQWKRMQTQTRAFRMSFLAQIGSGAVLAVALTSLFLLPALHSHPPVSTRTAQFIESQAQERERADAAIPMESLLQTPTPRAALLWTNPQPGPARPKTRRPDMTAPAFPSSATPIPPSKQDTPARSEQLHRSALPGARAFG